MTSKEAEIAKVLEAAGATAGAAERAAKEIAARWADREFWLSATLAPVERCAAESPEMPRAREVVKHLEIGLDVRIHDVPEWEPGAMAGGRPPATPPQSEGKYQS